MTIEFRFPLRSEERVVLIASSIITLAIPFLLLTQIQLLAEASGKTLGDVLAVSWPLRATLATLALLLVMAAAAAFAWVRHRAGARLVIGDDVLVYDAPAPLVVRGKEPSRRIPRDQIRTLRVRWERAAFTRQPVVEVTTLLDRLTLPLDRAVRDGVRSADYEPGNPETWKRHDLVRALEAFTGHSCERG